MLLSACHALQVNFKGERRPFADGGGTDNLAVTPLLRRGITHIVSCIASITHIDNTTNIDDYAIAQWDIAGLFGAVPLKHETLGKRGQIKAFGLTPEELNTATQVWLVLPRVRSLQYCRLVW